MARAGLLPRIQGLPLVLVVRPHGLALDERRGMKRTLAIIWFAAILAISVLALLGLADRVFECMAFGSLIALCGFEIQKRL